MLLYMRPEAVGLALSASWERFDDANSSHAHSARWGGLTGRGCHCAPDRSVQDVDCSAEVKTGWRYPQLGSSRDHGRSTVDLEACIV